jgi:hypothetical protein
MVPWLQRVMGLRISEAFGGAGRGHRADPAPLVAHTLTPGRPDQQAVLIGRDPIAQAPAHVRFGRFGPTIVRTFSKTVAGRTSIATQSSYHYGFIRRTAILRRATPGPDLSCREAFWSRIGHRTPSHTTLGRAPHGQTFGNPLLRRSGAFSADPTEPVGGTYTLRVDTGEVAGGRRRFACGDHILCLRQPTR